MAEDFNLKDLEGVKILDNGKIFIPSIKDGINIEIKYAFQLWRKIESLCNKILVKTEEYEIGERIAIKMVAGVVYVPPMGRDTITLIEALALCKKMERVLNFDLREE